MIGPLAHLNLQVKCYHLQGMVLHHGIAFMASMTGPQMLYLIQKFPRKWNSGANQTEVCLLSWKQDTRGYGTLQGPEPLFCIPPVLNR